MERICGCVQNGAGAPKKYQKLYRRWKELKSRHEKEWCSEWNDFNIFLEDMGNSDLYLQRKDQNKPYSKSNCYWSEQHPLGRPITYGGVAKNISQWAKEIGITRERLRQRLANRTIEEALDLGKTKIRIAPSEYKKRVRRKSKKREKVVSAKPALPIESRQQRHLRRLRRLTRYMIES